MGLLHGSCCCHSLYKTKPPPSRAAQGQAMTVGLDALLTPGPWLFLLQPHSQARRRHADCTAALGRPDSGLLTYPRNPHIASPDVKEPVIPLTRGRGMAKAVSKTEPAAQATPGPRQL